MLIPVLHAIMLVQHVQLMESAWIVFMDILSTVVNVMYVVHLTVELVIQAYTNIL